MNKILIYSLIIEYIICILFFYLYYYMIILSLKNTIQWPDGFKKLNKKEKISIILNSTIWPITLIHSLILVPIIETYKRRRGKNET